MILTEYPRYPQVEPHAHLHTCSVCGHRDGWADAWTWYGSLADLDAGSPVLKFCSDGCREEAREDGTPEDDD